MLKKDSKEEPSKKLAEKPVSLHPLKFESAVGALLEIEPEPRRKKKNRDQGGKDGNS